MVSGGGSGGGSGAATTETTPTAPAISRNVPLTLLYKSLDALASGVWSSGATSAYVLLLFEGTSRSATVAIGAAQALQGCVLAAAALPLSYAADKLGRARIARLSALLALLAAALTSAAVLWPELSEGALPPTPLPPPQRTTVLLPSLGVGAAAPPSAAHSAVAQAPLFWALGPKGREERDRLPPLDPSDARSFRLLCGALAVWGAAAAVGPSIDALFADSLPTGGRSGWFQLAYALSLASRSVGPLLAALLFWRSGDEWRLPVLRRVIVAGQALSVFPAAVLFLLRDDAALGQESEGALAARRQQQREQQDDRSAAEPLLLVEEEQDDDDEEEDHADADADADNATTTPSRRFLLQQHHVPYILAASDLVTGLASGMTIKFLPVFFIQEVGLAPTAVNVVMACSPLLIALASAAAARVARSSWGGRVQTTLACKALGVALLLWLAADPSLWRRPVLVAAIFLARTGLMNATYPLSRSVLSDYVAKSRRARWNALESVTAMSWSGSAAAGGWIIERRGYSAAFGITAAMQGAALLGFALLLPLVPRREGAVREVARRRRPRGGGG
jgi:MFS family permease